MQPQSEKFAQTTTKISNPLEDIAANLGVTPKVLTELATGDDKEFRELVRGIFSILPESEVVMVANDPDINPEFLDYLCKLFDANQKVLLSILQNTSSNPKTKQFILDRLPKDVLASIARSAKVSPELRQMITDKYNVSNTSQGKMAHTDEFKIKMKVSRLLNDLEANLGVSIDAFLKIKSKEDGQSQEFVREVYDALPEDHVLIVSSDPDTTPLILNYLSRLFDTNHTVLAKILQNPTTDEATRDYILDQLPDEHIASIAGNPKAPPELLRFLGKRYKASEDIQMVLLANPATPVETKKFIHGDAQEPDIEEVTEDLLIMENEATAHKETAMEETAPNEEDEQLIEDFFNVDLDTEGEKEPTTDVLEAKIELCMDKLYAINAEIVSQYIKKAHSEILKRIKLVSRANQVILTAVAKNSSLTIQDLDTIDMKTFIMFVQKTPGYIDPQTALQLIKKAKKKKKE